MVCLYCSGKSQVANSRRKVRLNQTWRRRICLNCHSIFTTVEIADYGSSWIVKAVDGLLPFSRDQLFISIYDSCKHRESALTDASGLTDTIIGKLRTSAPNGVIERKSIVQNALVVLTRFDKAACSYYEAFHKI
jgi:transcriptional regulator NrdR family protein